MVLDTLIQIVFEDPYDFNGKSVYSFTFRHKSQFEPHLLLLKLTQFDAFPDTDVTKQVNSVATLVLGAVAHYVKPHKVDWSNDVSRRLVQRLGVHGNAQLA